MTGLRDDVVHLREWIGAGFTAGAEQNHDHNGVNSAAVAGEIGFVRVWPGLVLPGATWDWCDGGTLVRATYPTLQGVLMKSANITVTIANPAVVTWVGHDLRTNMPIRFFTTGALPTGITAGTHGGPGVGAEYFVKVVNADTFNIAATPGGANIITTGAQNGVHTAVVAPHGDGDGATTFHKPDMRGRVAAGRDDMGGTAANRLTSGGSGILGNVPGRAGGAETTTLSQANLPSYNLGVSHNANTGATANGTAKGSAGGTSGASITVSSNGSGTAHQNTQQTGVYDFIIKIS
jgi:microcystin-dependent protein